MDSVIEWIKNINIKSCDVVFAEKVVKQILDPNLIEFYDGKLTTYMEGNRNGTGFPGCLAISIVREKLFLLKENDYKILMKSDGIRYMMFIFEYINENGMNCRVVDMIDRVYTHYIVPLSFGGDLFNGTLFDGELLKTKNGLYEFHIFDCVMYCGKYIGNEPHNIRLSYAKSCISNLNLYQFNFNHPFKIIVKEYVDSHSALQLLYDHSEYPIDGWILIDTKRPYISGRDDFLFKFKMLKNITIDLKLCIYDGVLNLCITDTTGMKPVQNVTKFSQDVLNNLKVSNESMLVGYILECKWNTIEGLWDPVCIRLDKDIPNNMLTFQQTIKNITENITETEIYDKIH